MRESKNFVDVQDWRLQEQRSWGLQKPQQKKRNTFLQREKVGCDLLLLADGASASAGNLLGFKKSSKLSWQWEGNQLHCWGKKNRMLWQLSGSWPLLTKKLSGGSGWWLTSLRNRGTRLLVWPNAYGEALPKPELLHKFAKAHSALWHVLHMAQSLES